MQIYDISLNIHPQMPVWPGDPKVKMDLISKIEDGDTANVTHLAMTAHAGTHIDAPYHFLGCGATTVEKIPLKVLIGRAFVVNIAENVDLITAEVLKLANIPPRTKRLLFKTRNSEYWSQNNVTFQEDFVALSPDGAQYLIDRGVILVGIDYLSIAPFADGIPTHSLLLQAGVVIVEGLDLSKISQGRYSLYCLPLKILGADGAPARAILVGA